MVEGESDPVVTHHGADMQVKAVAEMKENDDSHLCDETVVRELLASTRNSIKHPHLLSVFAFELVT